MRPDGPIVLFKKGKIIVLKDDNDAFIEKLNRPFHTHRASFVYPINTLKRIAFKVIRKVFGDWGKMANWTRVWRGPWYADMAPFKGPELGPFNTRKAAIEAEKIWLWENEGI